ncbi:MAG: hypothetical protein V3T23_08265, partial [Nitrososphaerales archaeon]
MELEETGDNTSTFAGTLEYTMISQVSILDARTYEIDTIDDEPEFILIEDETDEDSPRVFYRDRGTEGTLLRQGDQQEGPSHSGVVSFNAATYKIASPVTITLQDTDLNTDVDVIDIYTPVNPGLFPNDPARDLIGREGLPNFIGIGPLGRILDITFDDLRWSITTGTVADGTIKRCVPNPGGGATGLFNAGTTMIETGPGTGIFTGNFKIPGQWCRDNTDAPETTTGLDLEVNYLDFRDASGEIIEVGDSAGIRANTGSISLDRTVYPVPFGQVSNFAGSTATTPTDRSVFPIHQTGVTTGGLSVGETLPAGDLTIHIRVSDPDFNVSPGGENQIRQNTAAGVGVVKISVKRGSNTVVIGYAGGPSALDGQIDVGDNNATKARQFGPMIETSPTSAVFESDIIIRYTDGPASALCPPTTDFTPIDGSADIAANPREDRFDAAPSVGNFCILQGDILQVEYTDPTDASGDINTVTDSAAFDLRNGVLQSDKSVYIIGSDMIMTLIEPDFDLDNDSAETYDLDLIEWDSDAATITMGDKGGKTNAANFDPEPTDFRETGDSTGIFQIVIEIPQELAQSGAAADRLERGEEAVLEYTDWGPSGSDFVGDEDEDINLTIYTSNFGATVELDQKVYTWTDKVYVTIIAPDHNFDSDLIDEIGRSSLDPIKIATRGFNLDQYKLVETGTDTGIFTGEVILTGFNHDADGDTTTGASGEGGTIFGGDTNPRTIPKTSGGPTDGFLQTDDDDGLTVSFEFSEDETVVGSALIRWNIGETRWLEASYPASGTGVVRII